MQNETKLTIEAILEAIRDRENVIVQILTRTCETIVAFVPCDMPEIRLGEELQIDQCARKVMRWKRPRGVQDDITRALAERSLTSNVILGPERLPSGVRTVYLANEFFQQPLTEE